MLMLARGEVPAEQPAPPGTGCGCCCGGGCPTCGAAGCVASATAAVTACSSDCELSCSSGGSGWHESESCSAVRGEARASLSSTWLGST
eukprot:846538-Prymnesium_polylepis.1